VEVDVILQATRCTHGVKILARLPQFDVFSVANDSDVRVVCGQFTFA
jgi:hypothetical protein